jgi:hypothetical protein
VRNNEPVGMTTPCTGGCSCGAVRYVVTRAPLAVYACHCTDCQRSSGTAFTLSMLLDRATFEVTQGEAVPYAARMAHGAPASGCMCGDCGTRLWRVARTQQHLMMLRAGTLDKTGWLRPVAHFWTRSAQPWLVLQQGPGRYETQPSSWDELIALAHAQAGAHTSQAGPQG